MKKIALFAVALALSGASLLPASAAPLACPACKMPMPTAKAAGFTAPVLVHGKKYYCCTKCPIGIKAAAYSKSHKGMAMVAVK